MLLREWTRRRLCPWIVGLALAGPGTALATAQEGTPQPAAPGATLPPPAGQPEALPPPAGQPDQLPPPTPAEQPAPPAAPATDTNKALLERPLETPPEEKAGQAGEDFVPVPEPLLRLPMLPPTGFSGPSSVVPRDVQTSSHFVPVEDRWRVGFPPWDRYGHGPYFAHDVPYELGRLIDPYQLNVIKGDYPIIGQNTFLEITGISRSIFDVRQVPTPQNGFDVTQRPGGEQALGRPNQFVYNQFLTLSIDLNHGDSAFKPTDWRIHVTPVFNVNDLAVEEVGVVSPDVRKGTTRDRTWFALQEWFVEGKIADLSPDYDFVSVRAGSQFFNEDFRGFLFVDTNRAARIFGTLEANRDQFNIIGFKELEKDTNSGLNTFQDRHQNIFIGNFFRQDFLFPGYTAEFSVAYDSDRPTFHFDKNGFLTRPDPAGVAQPHGLDVVYLGLGGDGHIGRLNISDQFYWALGRDSLNEMAGHGVDVNAQMAAVELSYDRDWVRFRTSFFWASGDEDPRNGEATGFDTIDDNPNFVGGQFSYWNRQPIKLLGVNLKQEFSLVPDLRASKFEGQANFVNPGIYIANWGMDFELTPKLRWINNWNLLWFDRTEVLKQFLFQGNIHHFIGADLSSGMEYRPLLSNNIIMTFGVSTLIPGGGFKDLYNNTNSSVNTMVAAFMDVVLAF